MRESFLGKLQWSMKPDCLGWCGACRCGDFILSAKRVFKHHEIIYGEVGESGKRRFYPDGRTPGPLVVALADAHVIPVAPVRLIRRVSVEQGATPAIFAHRRNLVKAERG
jgi:hypothetical protein